MTKEFQREYDRLKAQGWSHDEAIDFLNQVAEQRATIALIQMQEKGTRNVRSARY